MATLNLFVVESWIYLGIDTLIVTVRCAIRWRKWTIRELYVDDFLMIVVLLLYGAETAIGYVVGSVFHGLANSGLTAEQRAALNPEGDEWDLRVKGAQAHLSGWLIYTTLLWSIKLCWLFFYKRLGYYVEHMAVKIKLGFALCAVTFIGNISVILFGCWPMSRHWQVNPDPGNPCQLAVARLPAWTMICTNLATDLYIMSIPFPIVWHAPISKRQKVGLFGMFSAGLVTAVFGCLRCAFILKGGSIDVAVTARWSHREAFVAIFILNIPMLLPMFRYQFGCVKAVVVRVIESNMKDRSDINTIGLFSQSSHSKEPPRKKFRHPLSLPEDTCYDRWSSEEKINDSS